MPANRERRVIPIPIPRDAYERRVAAFRKEIATLTRKLNKAGKEINRYAGLFERVPKAELLVKRLGALTPAEKDHIAWLIGNLYRKRRK